VKLFLALLPLLTAASPLGEAVKQLAPEGATVRVSGARPREARRLERELGSGGPVRVDVTLRIREGKVRAELRAVQPRFDLLRPTRWWRRAVVELPLDATMQRIVGTPVKRKLGKPRAVELDVPALAVGVLDGVVHVATGDVVVALTPERRRFGLLGEPAMPRSRVPVATIVADGESLLVRSSEQAVVTRIANGTSAAGEAVWPICEGVSGRLVPGTPLLAAPGQRGEWIGLACAPGLGQAFVAVDGHFRVRAADGSERTGEGAGAAVALVDLDRDGRAELASASASPPGGGDRLLLDGKPLVDSAGPIVSIASGDVNDDGLDDLLWIVRSGNRATLWILE
jgi:hypothetical protein